PAKASLAGAAIRGVPQGGSGPFCGHLARRGWWRKRRYERRRLRHREWRCLNERYGSGGQRLLGGAAGCGGGVLAPGTARVTSGVQMCLVGRALDEVLLQTGEGLLPLTCGWAGCGVG